MSEPLWRTAKCTSCKDDRASIVIVRWGFDKDGMFEVYGVCRWCLRASTIRHTREEINGDIREAFNSWVEEAKESGSRDFRYWEHEIGDDDEG